MLVTCNDPFLKQSAPAKDRISSSPHSFIHSVTRSTQQSGLFCDRFSCPGMGVGAQGRPEAVRQPLRTACVLTLFQFLKIMSMYSFSNQETQS